MNSVVPEPTGDGGDVDPEVDVGPADEDSLVRAFTLTGGRTRNDDVHVAVQSVVCQSARSLAAPPVLAPVETEIWRVAEHRLSAAEISARLELPVGVVRVLVGDLVTAGLLDLGRTVSRGDAKLVRRLIDGVRAL